MENLVITVAGDLRFLVRFEHERAPNSCAAFAAVLPFRGQLLQARWSGEAAWMPLGRMNFGVGLENATSHPAPGQILLYSGGYSETEILFPYGSTTFSSKLGQLAGNHFLTVVGGDQQLVELGRRVLWEGAQEIVFESTSNHFVQDS
jgi:hypothetical protein